jgi:coenzyme F420-reducing hydrogenase beta subunit
MMPDEEGFLYPEINAKLCIDCGTCVRACSFKSSYSRAHSACDPEYYAVVHKDTEVLENSRSGGIFFAIAKEFLSRGGVLYGVALDGDFNALTVRVDSASELWRLQGSKYVQSDKGDSFKSVISDLKGGTPVLYSGTACEISGLLSYVRECNVSDELLYTCDLVCHGTPSPYIWRDNLAYIEKKLGGKPDSLRFRDKCVGWAPHIESYTRGGKTVYDNRYTSVFYSDAALRPSCSSCHFCNLERPSDITLADFWGVEKLGLAINTSRGVSCLTVSTAKGKALFESAKDAVNAYQVRREDTIQPNLERPSPASPRRDAFWKDYKAHGYLFASKRFYGIKERLKLIYNVIVRRNRK